MNVCVLAPFRVIPQMNGAARRVFEICAAISSSGVSVILLHAGTSCIIERGFQVIGFPALENCNATKHFQWSQALDTYLSSANPALCRTLTQVMKKNKINILQLEGPWSILATNLVKALDKVTVVYDSHNVESLSVRFSSSVGWMWPWATLLEKKAVNSSELVFCVSELDKTKMCHLYDLPGRKVVVVPNGVRNSNYRMDSGNMIRTRLGISRNSKIVFFHGDLGWRPNAQAAQIIVESIAPSFQRSPEIMFLIAGSHPSQKILETARSSPNVRILGYVPDIEQYICAAEVCVAPMTTGSGTKLKILEYLAAGKPVVATQKAVEGLEVVNGIHGFVFDNVGEEFIRAIRAAMMPELSQKLGIRAKDFADHFDWSIIGEKIIEAYESLLDN